MRASIIMGAMILLFAVTGCASEMESKNVVNIRNAWARPVEIAPGTSKGGSVGAVYMDIRNSGSTSDRLVGMESSIAQTVEIHHTTVADGIMNMEMLHALELDGGAAVELKPARYHLMLVGLKQDLKAGTSFPLTLRFQNAGAISVAVEVRQP